VEAVIIASPQSTHRAIAEAAFALGKPVFCEKPLGRNLWTTAGNGRTRQRPPALPTWLVSTISARPASRFARKLIAEGAIGDITWFRGEHTEDFYADPQASGELAHNGMANGTMGDLAPHMINAALALAARSHRLDRRGRNRPRNASRRHRSTMTIRAR
jgi:predicted dehydrogenase